MYDLHSRYTGLKNKISNEQRLSWENYVKSYERHPYLRRDGKVDVNFGQFKFKIDNFIDVFSDLITEREFWGLFLPVDHYPDEETRLDWAVKISTCWHDNFINTWTSRIDNIRTDLFDMAMFGIGIEWWDRLGSMYPKSVERENVFPETSASMNPEEWGLCFIKQSVSFLDLYEAIRDEEIAENEGWNIGAVKELLLNKLAKYYPQSSPDDLMEKFRRGSLDGLNEEPTAKLLYAYVREYEPFEVKDGEGVVRSGYITHYILPEDGQITPTENGEQTREQRYLKKFPGYCEHIGNVIALRTYQKTRKFWQAVSYAEDIYVTCSTYDKVHNRLIRAAIRKSNLHITGAGPDVEEKMRQMDDSEVVVLDSNASIAQVPIGTDITDLSQVMRQLDFDTSRYTGEPGTTGSQNVKGRAITAKEAEINLSKESQSNSTDMDMFVLQDARYITELYRRSIQAVPGTPEHKALKRFRKKMEAYDIPKKVYDPENITVNSIFNLAAGSSASKTVVSDYILKYMSIRPSSKGEERAKRFALASVAGYSMVPYFMGTERQYEQDESQHAGLENEAFANPLLNPHNIKVSTNDNHVIHAESHITDAEAKIEHAKQFLSQLSSEETPIIIRAFVVDKATTVLLALDNNISHTLAHLELLSHDIMKKDTAAQLNQRLAPIRRVQGLLQQNIKKSAEALMQDLQQNGYLTQEQQIKLQNMQLELEHKARMQELDLGKKVDQVEMGNQVRRQHLQQEAEKHELNINAQAQKEALGLEAKRRQAATQLAETKLKQHEQSIQQGGSQKKVPRKPTQ